MKPQDERVRQNRQAIQDKIDRAFDRFERGEGLTAEESLARLEAKQAAWRSEQRLRARGGPPPEKHSDTAY
jgi:hypothetical protein